ncbi:hypothetical protein [Streptosporangium saharense]|uniref:hypothetical protein n=1 Tax=Streptosporangium saharense TaxID=1706840 RepID=UPI0034355533
MAREEARIFTAIWQDDDFLALDPGPQRLYLFLLSQPDLSYCGLIALRERRWSKKAKGLTVEQITEDLAALAGNPSGKGSPNPSRKGSPNPSGTPSRNPFLVIDDDTEEVFVRSLIRRDGIWKQPNLLKAAREAAGLIESPKIRAALLEELLRLPEIMTSDLGKSVLTGFIGDLSGHEGNPSPNPSGKGSPNPSPDPSSTPSQGKGDGYGDVVEGPPSPWNPSPVPPSAGTAPPRRPPAPPGADDEHPAATAQTLVAEYVEACHHRPPSDVLGQLGKRIKRLLDDGIPPDAIRDGIAAWAAKGLSPSTLPAVVNEVMNRAHTHPGKSRNTQIIDAAMERALAAEAAMAARNEPASPVRGELAS